MKLHLIGAGNPDPRPERYGSAFCLDMGSERVLVDCGPATTWKLAKKGLHPCDINTLFFTHHHTDHNVDFPCFALTRWDIDNGSCDPLQIYGPPPTRLFCEQVMSLDGPWGHDLRARQNAPASQWCHQARGGSLPRPDPEAHATDIDAGTDVVTTDAWRVSAARVQHVNPYLISLAYRFETARGSIVFGSDCTDCESLRQLAAGADLVVMACTYYADEPMDREMTECIAGVPQVISFAQAANPGRIVLTHPNGQFAKPGAREKAVAQIAREWDGAVLFPDELTTLEL